MPNSSNRCLLDGVPPGCTSFSCKHGLSELNRMVPFRSLLLGCAVALSSGAMAADLPATKAAPVEYVRICSTYGTGFFYVPGTEGCLRVSGRVRVEYLYAEPINRAQRCPQLAGPRPAEHRSPPGHRLRSPAHLYPLRDHAQLRHRLRPGADHRHQPANPSRASSSSAASPPAASRRSSRTRTCRLRTSATCASTTRRTRT